MKTIRKIIFLKKSKTWLELEKVPSIRPSIYFVPNRVSWSLTSSRRDGDGGGYTLDRSAVHHAHA